MREIKKYLKKFLPQEIENVQKRVEEKLLLLSKISKLIEKNVFRLDLKSDLNYFILNTLNFEKSINHDLDVWFGIRQHSGVSQSIGC